MSQYFYENASLDTILADKTVRRGLVEAYQKFPGKKIEQIKHLRGVILLSLKNAKDAVEYVETRRYLLEDWVRDIEDRKWHFDQAAYKCGDNKCAVKNYLKKHYYYSEDAAWEIVNEFMGGSGDAGVSLGDILAAALKARDAAKNYVVANLNGDVVLTGKSANDFVANADKLGVPRSSYRLFVEVTN